MPETLRGSIGVFDSGYGGLTILREIRKALPEYDYVYLGDNARAPYGTRSYDVVYRFTLEAVRYLFSYGCPLVILACNTASAKALRTIQQNDLPGIDLRRRVLGVIRPTAEELGKVSEERHVGVLGTPGTVNSGSYEIEIEKLWPGMKVTSHGCPMWVPLVENGEAASEGADYFVKKEIDAVMSADPQIDTLVLACTHYPLLMEKIRAYTSPDVKILAQGEIVAASLADYLHRHPEMDDMLTRGGAARFLTTENPDKFAPMAAMFMGHPVEASHAEIDR